MALSFKSNSYGFSILALFGVNPNLISKCQAMGVMIDQTSPGTFVVKSNTGEAAAMIPVKVQAITMAKSGNMGPASKDAIKYQFESAMEKALKASTASNVPAAPYIDELAEEGGEVNQGDYAPSQKYWTPDEDGNVTPVQSIAPGKKAKVTIPPYSGPQIEVVDLATAEAAGTYVQGTSASSVYVIAARFDGLNMALRLSAMTLSLRVAGSKLENYMDRLKEIGFAVKGGYASIHFSVPSSQVARRTLGAVIATIGLDSLVEVSDVLEVSL